MRIGLNALFLIPGKVGGTEIYVRNLVRSFAGLPHQFLLYVNREAAGTFDPLPANVTEVRVPLKAENRAMRIAYEQVQLPLRAHRDRVDVLHSLGYTGPLVATIPTVVTLHDLNYHFHPEDWTPAGLWANRALIPLVAKRATRVLTISQSSHDAIVDVLDVPPERVDIVYHGIDGNLSEPGASTRAAVRKQFGLAGDFILSVTASHPHKNLDGLLGAYERICARRDAPPLVVVGIRGRAHDEVMAAAARWKRGRVVVTGWIDGDVLSSLYREATVFAFASKYEGFGFPVLEAMSVGTPVVSSSATSLAELVGDAALTFSPTDTATIASSIERVLDDAALRATLIEKGRAQADRFKWAQCARETCAVYERSLMSRA
ncbi:glycosyltransferase family 1 protein [soil metagenome]